MPVRKLAGRRFAEVPPADLCLFERRRYAGPLYKAGKGLPVHFCQGFEGVDIDVRLARLAAESRGWCRIRTWWRLTWRRLAVDRAYSLPTVKIVVQEHLRHCLSRRYRQPAYLVPNGIPETVFTPGSDASRDPRIVLVVGPMEIRCKRIPDALEAVRLVKRRCSDIRLIRVSQNPMSEAERQLNIADEYHVLLSPEKLAREYRRAAVLVFPSDETEGFGLPMVEAMACGTPVLATDIPAAGALDPRGGHVCLVPVARPDLLADSLVQLMNNSAERERLQRRGLEVAARYTRRRSHDLMEATLSAILDDNHTALAIGDNYVPKELAKASPGQLKTSDTGEGEGNDYEVSGGRDARQPH